MAEIRVRIAIDPFKTAGNALSCQKSKIAPMVSVDYDDEADLSVF